MIIGITGRARSGKSTVAKAILASAKEAGLSAKIYELSDYVLQDLKDSEDIPSTATREDLKENVSLLVKRGMERRKEDEDYWVKKLQEDYDKNTPDIAIVPNIRFHNEAYFVKNSSCFVVGCIIRVSALVKDHVEFISPDRDPNHESEITTYDIDADYFLTTKKGESKLLSIQATSLFNYLEKNAREKS